MTVPSCMSPRQHIRFPNCCGTAFAAGLGSILCTHHPSTFLHPVQESRGEALYRQAHCPVSPVGHVREACSSIPRCRASAAVWMCALPFTWWTNTRGRQLTLCGGLYYRGVIFLCRPVQSGTSLVSYEACPAMTHVFYLLRNVLSHLRYYRWHALSPLPSSQWQDTEILSFTQLHRCQKSEKPRYLNWWNMAISFYSQCTKKGVENSTIKKVMMLMDRQARILKH